MPSTQVRCASASWINTSPLSPDVMALERQGSCRSRAIWVHTVDGCAKSIRTSWMDYILGCPSFLNRRESSCDRERFESFGNPREPQTLGLGTLSAASGLERCRGEGLEMTNRFSILRYKTPCRRAALSKLSRSSDLAPGG